MLLFAAQCFPVTASQDMSSVVCTTHDKNKKQVYEIFNRYCILQAETNRHSSFSAVFQDVALMWPTCFATTSRSSVMVPSRTVPGLHPPILSASTRASHSPPPIQMLAVILKGKTVLLSRENVQVLTCAFQRMTYIMVVSQSFPLRAKLDIFCCCPLCCCFITAARRVIC